MAAVRTSGRPLPQPPQAYDREAAWYEHEERMRPSYIAQPAYQQQAFFQPSSPPVSPSARWASSPQKQQQQQQQQYFPQQYAFPTGPAEPVYYPTGATSRFKRDGGPSLSNPTPYVAGTGDVNATVRPRMSTIPSSRLASPQASGARGYAQVPGDDAGMRSGTAKGSAFMHKGFWDIMSLVNNPQGPPGTAGGPSRFKQTFSKATGGLKKVTSNTSIPQQASPDDLFFSAGGPPLSRPSPLAPLPAASNQGVSQQQVQQRTPSPASFYTADSRNQASTATAPNINGPRAQKKRISVDMVGKPQGFIHAAHASDAEQAEAILRRWGRDGVGKVADPAWIERCKEAMRVQAARNQAEAIAQIQAALHQESIIKENERPPLHIVNGAPSQSATTASTMTSTTVTAGHGTISTEPPRTPGEGRGFPGIQEEVSGEYTALAPPLAPALSPSPRRPSPVSGASSPPPAARPNMMPRSNTGGTMVVNPSPDVAAAIAQDAPDYLLFKPAKGSPTSPTTDKRASKAGQIDGLPGGAAGINALFDNRPTSMVVRDSAAPLSSTNLAAAVTPKQENRTLAGEELNATLAANAGAAMRPSLTTVEKSVAAKIFFENLYYGILKKPRDRDTRRAGLEAELASLRIPESAKDEIRAAWMANETEYLRDIRARVNVNSFIRLKTIGHGAFGVVALIKERGTGELFAMKQLRKADMLRKGQEGHVRAERDLMTSASASASAKWIVKLVYSFQDVDHLYLIMEFMGGGDLLNLLIEKDIFAEDFARFYVAEMILSIHEAHRLGYIHRDIKPDNFLFTSQGHIKLADFGLCQSFHWAHDGAYYDQQRRNLLKKHGIDLEDSTAAKRAAAGGGRGTVRGGATATTKGGELNDKELNDVMSDRNEDGTPLTHVLTWRDKNKKKIAYSVVGTNNYMAPEVLRGYGYDQSCDWWSLGVIVFEMLWGYPPFVSKSRHLTRQKILNWRQTLKFPPRPKVSREAQDFISKLICERDDRLGSTSTASVSRPNSLLQGSRQRSGFAAPGASTANAGGLQDGVEDLMAHPWFRGIDWNSIHKSPAPFKPALSHPADTKHFEDDIEAEPLPAPGAAEAAKGGQPPPVDAPRDPMLRDKAQGQHLLEMRKQLAFVGYTFKSPKGFDPKAQLSESKIVAAERRDHELQSGRGDMLLREPSQSGSRLRSMSM